MMDTPKSSKLAATATAEAVPAQESPIFSFIGNLSPIQPVKAPPVSHGFPGLNSPPLVFTSPRLNTRSKLASLKRGYPRESVVANENQETLLATREVTSDEKGLCSRTSMDDHIESPEECLDQFLSDVVNVGSADRNIVTDLSVKELGNGDHPQERVTGSNESNSNQDCMNKSSLTDDLIVIPHPVVKEIENESESKTPIDMSLIESDNNLDNDDISLVSDLKINSEFPVDNALRDQGCESKNECFEMRQNGPLGQSSNLLSGSIQTEKDKEIYVECSEPILSTSVLQDEQNGPEAFQHFGMRRRLQFEDMLQKVHEVPESLSQEIPLNSIGTSRDETVQPMWPKTINSRTNSLKPSGIGLHLNSIVNAGSEAVLHVRSVQRGNPSVLGKKSMPSTDLHVSDNLNISSVSYLAHSASANADENPHKIYSSMTAQSATSTLIIKPAKKYVVLNPVEEDQSILGNKRNFVEIDGGSEEFKSSPKKKRKKSDSGDGDGCKRCNCKKSRCLKLYCDCFAAGIYCAGPCACQGCCNRPEHEAMVLETRQQIESRNPLAFAPRVVQDANEASASNNEENTTYFTPSSARHKRGCNCKKSMCLKKYCECYQANVGCSDGCRCEGCKNVFGQKGEYGTIRNALSEEGGSNKTESSFIKKIVSSGKLCLNEVSNPRSLTPLTPTLQSFNKEASESMSQSGKYFLSSESSSLSFGPQCIKSPGSPGIADNNSMTSEITREIMDMIPSDQSLYYNKSELIPDVSTTTLNNSRLSSLEWRGSPNTPMLQQGTDISNILFDETPDILKDSATPVNAVKVTSPNKKRVSPPHNRQEMSSLSSIGVRTGRKFILKSVPSFPPLTPCVGSKSTAPQQIHDPRNHTDEKK